MVMPAKKRVTFYTKPGCHLCDEARQEILKADCEEFYTFEEVNIESDPELLRRYGLEIPVIKIDGITVFKYRLTAAQFSRAVKA